MHGPVCEGRFVRKFKLITKNYQDVESHDSVRLNVKITIRAMLSVKYLVVYKVNKILYFFFHTIQNYNKDYKL